MRPYLIILCIIILVLIILVNNKKKSKKFKFYKCGKYVLGKIIKTVLQNYNIERTENIDDKWSIFIPCTYNNVEDELNKVRKKKNKLLFGIKGCDLIVSKNNLWKLLEDKYTRPIAKTLMPETWILSNKTHMELFNNEFSKKNMYIMKKNIQRKEGLKLTNKLSEIVDNTDKKFKVVQKYMKDTYTINKRKINLRIYLLIHCKDNKLTSYYYKNGKCIYTNKDYNNSFDLEENITSLNLDVDIYKKNPFDLFELAEYMGIHKYTILLQNIQNNLQKLHSTYNVMLKKLNKNANKNTYFQLFGLDYIFDNDLNVYLLELNKGPDMSSKTDKDYILKYRIYEDLFNLLGILETTISKNMFIKI
tara:strand:+ start:90 stop:1172 length:1083 start_codon:yes stop_codon:yes gene_type:complete